MKMIAALTLISALLIYAAPNAAGLTMLFTILLFGGMSHFAKNRDEKLAMLGALVLLSLFTMLFVGVRLGIDFKGGTRIPATLSSPVEPEVMSEIVAKIKARVSSLGLEQVVVKAVGNDRIFIEVPAGDEALVSKIESSLTAQGVFIGVVDGAVVVEGKDIVPGTISSVPPSQLRGADWGISFSITREAAQKFASLVKGKAGYPLYLYLDKPYNATVILPSAWLEQQAVALNVSPVVLYDALQASLKDERGSVNLLLDTVEEAPSGEVITSAEIAQALGLQNATIVNESALIPSLSFGNNVVFPDRWEAVGLMSAPLLNPGVTDGGISLSYQITGRVPDNIVGQQARFDYAKQTERQLASILKGGAFPVKVYLGSKQTIPAPLGEKFLQYSLIGLAISMLAVSLFISLRYRNLRLILPIILITVAEVLILIATVGAFTIDLSAMAGIIAAVGVSIDAQIIITDEFLKAASRSTALKKAFEIINNNVILAILVFFPLFTTGIVEVVGFAVVSILAYILGALVSRPAYAAFVEHIFEPEEGV